MKKTYLIIFVLLLTAKISISQGTYEDYQRAEKFLHFNVYKLVQNIYLYPNWIDETNKFWFKTETENGHRFILVIPEENKSKPVFNHEKLAKQLKKELGKKVNSDSLPFTKIKLKDSLRTVMFKVDTLNFKYDLNKNILSKYTPKIDEQKKNESKRP